MNGAHYALPPHDRYALIDSALLGDLDPMRADCVRKDQWSGTNAISV